MTLPGYQLGVRLAHNEHSAVYRAVREQDGLPVIVKTLSREYPLPAEVRRLEFEYRMLDKLRGPRVIDALGLARTGGQLALILEDFGGRNLADVGLPLTLDAFFRVAREATLGLGHIHARDLIHKDIKPRNLVASADLSLVKFIDFQLSSEISREQKDTSGSQPLEGSLPYISPEQTGRMNRALDYRSDYYSLGVTFFELLTGELPFAASDVIGWLHCHISKPAPALRERVPALPIMLSRLVAKLMAKEPRDRYQSSRGLLADLERCEAWVREGRGEEEFELGKDDVSERFAVSQQLFGRQAEIRRATNALEQAVRGPGKLLAVSGYSGIGKSSLIRELHAPLTAHRGYFAAGKFDQLDRSVPYAGLVEAMRDLVRQLLGEPDARVREYKLRLLSHMGATASVIAELAPELASIIGPQSAPPPLEPVAAQNRLELAFARFIEAIASAEHPLLLFIDDLQWADASLPGLIADLFISHDVKHVLVVGAYRENEVTGTHLLNVALGRLREASPSSLVELRLEPLSETAIVELVASTLKCLPSDCAPLARVIHDKTHGNPFFARELLWTLYRQGAIALNAATGRWSWDLEPARTLTASQNVVELLLERFGKLHGDARLALQTAACVGNLFTLSTLASLLGRSPDETAIILSAPLADGLIIPLDENYKLMQIDTGDRAPHEALEVRYVFQHDRVQQAAYSLIPDADKAATHLSIGRRLLAAERDAEHPDDVFSATNHLNLGRASMTDLGERERLAKLNRKAAAKALAATAFDIAARYHEAAISALTAEEWCERPELRYALFSERVVSVLMAGERDRAALLCDDLFALAPTKADQAAVYLIKSQVAMHQGHMVGAIQAVRCGLVLLGIEYPEDKAEIERNVSSGIGKMQAHLARVPIDELVNLPECTDAEKIIALKLLYHVVPAAIMVYPPSFILAELIMFDLALTCGTTAACAKNFVDVGTIQGAVLGDYAAAYRLGQVAFRLLDRYDARALANTVYFVFAAYISHWRAPYGESLRAFETSRRLAIEGGDHQHLAFSEGMHLRLLLVLGRHLSECDAVARDHRALIERIRADAAMNYIRFCQLAIDQLRMSGDDAGKRLDAGPVTADILASGNAQYALQHGQMQMLVNVVLGDWDGALAWSEFTRARISGAATLFIVPEYTLLECLVTTQRRWPHASPTERPELLAELERHVEQLRRWRDGCPENFAHKYLLAAAEVARVKGEPAEAVVALYDQAIEATEHQFLHLRALGSELFGQFLLGLGRRRLAEPLLRDAVGLYARWGADAKVHALTLELERFFPHSRVQRGGSLARTIVETRNGLELDVNHVLDLASVLKATRAISSEVKSERMFATLMSAILENAAAQRGCLVLSDPSDQRLYVRARAGLEASDQGSGVQHPLEDEPNVCQQVVRLVARSLEPLVLDDAGSHPTFAADPYIAEHAVKSVLCMPIVNQGGLVAVLYVENNATSHAFTRDRVEVLRLIAGQAAVSLTNVALYEGLERMVADRTRELGAKHRKMAAMLDGIEQGVLTLDEGLRVQPEYSRHLEQLVGEKGLVGRDVMDVLFAGSDIDPAALAAHEAALRFSMGAPASIAHLNAAHLIKTYSRRGPDGSLREYEVDWNWITGEDGSVEQVLVAARDVTVLRGLERAAAKASREAELLAQILDAGLEDFKSFCTSAQRSLDLHLAATARGSLDAEQRRSLFRDIHTIKGHARTLGLDRITAAAHAAEESCMPGSSPVAASDASRALLVELAATIAEYEQTGERKLGSLWSNADARFQQALGAIESALEQTSQRPSYAVRALEQVKQVVHRLNAIPLDQVLRETSRVFPSLASELGKSVPELEWVDDGTLLDADWGRVMKDALVHTFRNSLDHGIESREEREASGKAARGKIALFTERDDHGVRIHLRDDGRGLPIDELRKKTGRLDDPDQDVAEAIFDYGVSTARQLSQVSGRGIGMDAVRAVLRERGGDVAISFTGDARAGYRPFELVFCLPNDAIAPDGRV